MTSHTVTAEQVANLIGGHLVGDGDKSLSGFNPFDKAGSEDLTFAVDEKRLAALADCNAGAVIVPAEAKAQASVTLIHVDRADLAIAKLLGYFAPPADVPPEGLHPSASIDPNAVVAESAGVGPNVVVGAGATIGDGTRLCANVVIGRHVQIGNECVLFPGAVIAADCQLGNRVRIGPNSVIGHEGFGYVQEEGVHRRVEHIGNVVIEDDVDIGACTCVDRAKFGSTRIGRGAKVDNLVQLAHNVQVGEGSLFAAQVGIGGSTKIGRYVFLGGNAGLRDNITIGDGVQMAAFTGVSNDIEPGMKVAGIPARDGARWRRIMVAEGKLPELFKRVKALEKKLDALG